MSSESNKKKISIKPNDDFSDVINEVGLLPYECAKDIFKFVKTDYGLKPTGLFLYGVIQFLTSEGYFSKILHDNAPIIIKDIDNVISKDRLGEIRHKLLEHAMSLEDGLDVQYGDKSVHVPKEKLVELVLQHSQKVVKEDFLQSLPLHDKPILRDDKFQSYFFFLNTIAVVSKAGLNFRNYSDLDYCCIWDGQIIQRNLNYNENEPPCHFRTFIENVTNRDEKRFASVTSAIGYLVHNYINVTDGQAIILYDEEITDIGNPKGGTGKGLFANAISQVCSTVKIDGKKFDTRDKFRYQNIKQSTQVVWLDDVKPSMGFDTFHSALTDGWTIEKKYETQVYIPPVESPKLLICSNSILTRSGTTNIRRQFILEFSNHYSKHLINGTEEPIKEEHGCMFFDDDHWDQTEWDSFFSFVLDCSQFYFKKGLVTYEHINVAKNLLLQNTCEEFVDWLEQKGLKLDERYNTKDMFNHFKLTYFGEDSKLKQVTFSRFIKTYATGASLRYDRKKSNGESYFILSKK